MLIRHTAIFFELLALLVIPAISNASTSGKLNFSGRIFIVGCLIDQQHKSVQIQCGKSPHPQRITLASSSRSVAEFALPDNRGEASVLWLNKQHTEADLIVKYR
ncbi:hypothetical protein MXM41_01520 [Leclercia adecarboxylata]|uniref:hypothetical protein n=1 Tax=Leclercia adecarboxylata TaxID=83655 RepID=UPI002DB9137C|nr:hypothetical protein [Leclercia adecarboxylata]MEB6377624.1 hypothetical protein [Leclercia adecarboxylata]